jgi:hypothetical protein
VDDQLGLNSDLGESKVVDKGEYTINGAMSNTEHGVRVMYLNNIGGRGRRDTKQCAHYAKVNLNWLKAQKGGAETLCASRHDGCAAIAKGVPNTAKHVCHVAVANQSSRYIVYCCSTCNWNKKGKSFNVRPNAIMHNLDGKPCKYKVCRDKRLTHPTCDCDCFAVGMA